jgi:hypothetical protein
MAAGRTTFRELKHTSWAPLRQQVMAAGPCPGLDYFQTTETNWDAQAHLQPRIMAVGTSSFLEMGSWAVNLKLLIKHMFSDEVHVFRQMKKQVKRTGMVLAHLWPQRMAARQTVFRELKRTGCTPLWP